MIPVTKIRDLNLTAAIQEGRPPFLSAASGLVRVGGFLYVVADDENHLAVFRSGDPSPGEVLRLFEGDLPFDKEARKKVKPDLEAITFLPASPYATRNALLCIPSGSRTERRAGARVPLDSTGAVEGRPEYIDLTIVFAFFERCCGPLNIEAVAVQGTSIYFLNRGNKKQHGNALIGLSLQAFWAAIREGVAPKNADLIAHHPLDLGEMQGVPLTPTDAVIVSPGRMIFTAAAEATDNSYDDGACLGSAIGVLDLDGKLLFLDTVDTTRKLEGIDARREAGRISLLLVNDEDSHTHPSELISASLSQAQCGV